jgi:site-specific recombinase XerC
VIPQVPAWSQRASHRDARARHRLAQEHGSPEPRAYKHPCKLSALSSLFDYLCERNAVLGNPVDGVKRPASNNKESSASALGDAHARRLLEALPRTR